MRRSRFATCLLSGLVAFAAPLLAGNTQPPVPLLWKVSDADNSVYLLGSFHMLHGDDYPLSNDLDVGERGLFRNATELVFVRNGDVEVVDVAKL